MADTPPRSVTSEDAPNVEKKSRRPANTAFRQQRLKAWQPILTPKTVLPLFFAIGIVFAPIGGLLLYASSQVQELKIDYTNCATDAPLGTTLDVIPSSKIISHFKSSNSSVSAQWRRENTSFAYRGDFTLHNLTRCVVQFTIPENMKPPVLFYYHLTNFYQNHRRYVSSFYDKQLKGDSVSLGDVTNSACTPLEQPSDNKTVAYYPCGLIANSVFNDTIDSPVWLNPDNGQSNETYFMKDTGIAWSSDKKLYGKYPADMDFNVFIPPPNWQTQYPDRRYSNDTPPPDLSEDEHFMVWMRTAGLPTFSKLYMRNDTQTMKAGTYSISIIDTFPTDVYEGTKSLENEKYPTAINDSRASLNYKLELYPQESEIVAEAHYKLSLALEFASVTTSDEDSKEGPKAIDQDMRDEAASELEKAITSTKMKLQASEVDLALIHAPEENEYTRKQISEVKDIIADMEQRLVDLRKPPMDVDSVLGAANPMSGILGAALGESTAETQARVEEAKKHAHDLSGLVRKKEKKPEPATSAPAPAAAPETNGKRKAEEPPEGHDADTKKHKAEEQPAAAAAS